MSRRLMVLGYHNIDPTPAWGGSTAEVARRGFERQVRFLRRFTNVVPLRSALADLAEGRPLPPRAVALTFDDGYLDNMTFAAPVLHAAGLPATFFLVPGFLDGTSRVWWEELGWSFAFATVDRLDWDGERYDVSTPPARDAAHAAVADALKNVDAGARGDAVTELRGRLAPVGPEPGRQFMDWNEADRLVTLGHDIGSHTCAHPIMSQEQPDEQAHQLVDSRRALQSHFDLPVDVLAFPNGRAQDYSADTLRLTAEAGYAFAVTTRTAVAGAQTPPHEVPRVLLDAETDLREVVLRGLRVVKQALPSRSRG